MNATILIAIAGLSTTALIQAAAVLIWGASLTQRVRRIEADINDLKSVGERLARLETQMQGLFDQLRDLNASVRWMRQPAGYSGETDHA